MRGTSFYAETNATMKENVIWKEYCSWYVVEPRKFATLVRTNRYLGRRKISRAILSFPTMRLELSALHPLF